MVQVLLKTSEIIKFFLKVTNETLLIKYTILYKPNNIIIGKYLVLNFSPNFNYDSLKLISNVTRCLCHIFINTNIYP